MPQLSCHLKGEVWSRCGGKSDEEYVMLPLVNDSGLTIKKLIAILPMCQRRFLSMERSVSWIRIVTDILKMSGSTSARGTTSSCVMNAESNASNLPADASTAANAKSGRFGMISSRIPWAMIDHSYPATAVSKTLLLRYQIPDSHLEHQSALRITPLLMLRLVHSSPTSGLNAFQAPSLTQGSLRLRSK